MIEAPQAEEAWTCLAAIPGAPKRQGIEGASPKPRRHPHRCTAGDAGYRPTSGAGRWAACHAAGSRPGRSRAITTPRPRRGSTWARECAGLRSIQGQVPSPEEAMAARSAAA